MSTLLKLAKKYANRPTEFNKIQFIDEFNSMSDDDQIAAVQKGSELSKILIGWCAEVRIEFDV